MQHKNNKYIYPHNNEKPTRHPHQRSARNTERLQEENLNVDQTKNEASAHHIPVEKAKERLLRIASELNDGNGTRAGGGIAGIDQPITSVTALDQDKQILTRGQEG